MKYCTRCPMPETKTDLYFDDDGVCSACRNFERRNQIDREARKKAFAELMDVHRNPDGYDCLVPVSGGKDSHFQTIAMLEMGLRPLCVTMTTDHLSDIGRRNIENLKSLGVDYIEITPNPVVRRKIARFALETVGDISYCEHSSIFGGPIEMARRMEIPLVIYGELSQDEYGGPLGSEKRTILDRRWREEFGGLLGLRTADLIDILDLSPADVAIYAFSNEAHRAVEEGRVVPVFLGQYLPWDGFLNACRAYEKGFNTFDGKPPGIFPGVKAIEGQVSNYENLDNTWTGCHDYFKFLKFGFGRATDILSMWIRRGRISREAAIPMVKERERFPWTYLGYPLSGILDEISMGFDEFIRICDKFTNKKIFRMDSAGNLVKDEDLTPILREEIR